MILPSISNVEFAMNVTRMLFAQVIYKPGYDIEMCRNVQCAEITYTEGLMSIVI